MIWGCQWDATLRWMQTSSNEEVANFPTNSEGKGHYRLQSEDMEDTKKIPTGSNSAYAVNNIYDMAGNEYEWTIETYGTTKRVLRGGVYLHKAWESGLGDNSADNRNSNFPDGATRYYGCRTTLYIK